MKNVVLLPLKKLANETKNKLVKDKKLIIYETFNDLNSCILFTFRLIENDREKAQLTKINYTKILNVFWKNFDDIPLRFEIAQSDLDKFFKYLKLSIIMQQAIVNLNSSDFPLNEKSNKKNKNAL